MQLTIKQEKQLLRLVTRGYLTFVVLTAALAGCAAGITWWTPVINTKNIQCRILSRSNHVAIALQKGKVVNVAAPTDNQAGYITTSSMDGDSTSYTLPPGLHCCRMVSLGWHIHRGDTLFTGYSPEGIRLVGTVDFRIKPGLRVRLDDDSHEMAGLSGTTESVEVPNRDNGTTTIHIRPDIEELRAVPPPTLTSVLGSFISAKIETDTTRLFYVLMRKKS